MISREKPGLAPAVARAGASNIICNSSPALIIDYWSKPHLSCHWGLGDAMGTFTFLPQLAFDEDGGRIFAK